MTREQRQLAKATALALADKLDDERIAVAACEVLHDAEILIDGEWLSASQRGAGRIVAHVRGREENYLDFYMRGRADDTAVDDVTARLEECGYPVRWRD